MIREGMSIRQATQLNGVSKTTALRNLQADRVDIPMRTASGVLSVPPDVQAEIAEVVCTAAKYGFGLQRDELKVYVGDFVKKNWDMDSSIGQYFRINYKFVDKVPGDEWIRSFMQDHHLSLRKFHTSTHHLPWSNPACVPLSKR
jgi:hypothetical protein